jgi:hypothetical protein
MVVEAAIRHKTPISLENPPGLGKLTASGRVVTMG